MSKAKAILSDSTMVTVYNDGPLAFVYDEASAETIYTSNMLLLQGFSRDEILKDAAWCELAGRGLIFAYELFQDDELCVEIRSGSPLTQKEMGKLPWLAPQKTFLSLPSGKLRIDSYNSLPVDDSYDDSPGAIVELTPGNYIVNLHRLDQHAVSHELSAASREVLIFQPTKRIKPPSEAQALILYPRTSNVEETENYRIVNGDFHGQILFPDPSGSFIINMDRATAQQLGLKSRTSFSVEVSELNKSFRALYLSSDDMMEYAIGNLKIEEGPKKGPEFVLGCFGDEGDDDTDLYSGLLFFQRPNAKQDLRNKLQNKWFSIIVRL